MTISIRHAVETDQPIIVSFVRQAKLNPRNLHWQNFVIAEEDHQVVGIRQIKTHKQGTCAVASGFVLPEYRRQSISARLMSELVDRETGPLYTMVDEKWALYYEQFGFWRLEVSQLPTDFLKEYRIGRISPG